MKNIFKIILTLAFLSAGSFSSFGEEAAAHGEVSENNVDCSKINGSTTNENDSDENGDGEKPKPKKVRNT